MKRLTLALMLVAGPAMAQQPPPLQSSIDAGIAQVSRIVNGFGNEIAVQAQQIDQMQRQVSALQKQVADVTAERDALKAKAAEPGK